MPTPLVDGQYTIAATATTALGESRPTYLLIVIDRAKPTIQLQTIINQQFLPLVTNRAIAGGTRLVGVLDGTGSPIQHLTYQLTPSSAAVPIPVSKAGLINQVLAVGRLAPDQHQLRFTAIDVAGNQRILGPFRVGAPTKTAAIEPSQVTVRLLEDSGRDATDGLTNRADMVGFIIGSKKLLRLQARLQPLSASSLATTAQLESLPYRDITHLVESNGTFWLKPEQLNLFDRNSLPEGRYTLHLRGEFAGKASMRQQLSWILEPDIRVE